VEGKGRIEGLVMRADSCLQQDASVTLTVVKSDGQERALFVCHPAWASALEFQLARQKIAPAEKDGYAEIRRAWKQGDHLRVRYVLRTRLLEQAAPKRIAFMHGPWFLGVDEPHSPAFFDEPSAANRILLPVADRGQYPRLGSEKEAAPKPALFRVPVAHLELRYLPGGYPIQPQTACLRPLAEQTGLGDGTPWVLWFEAKP